MSPTAVAVIVAVAAPLLTYLAAWRRFSGRIGSSDAEQLWAESRSIREWSAGRISDQNVTVGRLEQRVASLEATNAGLVVANRKLIDQVGRLNDTITTLRGEVRQLTDELRLARKRVEELEAQ